MNEDLSELFVIFVEESRGRVRQVRELCPRLRTSPDALAAVRRELHTVKGCARLIGFSDLASACEEGERWIDDGVDDLPERLGHLADRLEEQIARREAAGPAGAAG